MKIIDLDYRTSGDVRKAFYFYKLFSVGIHDINWYFISKEKFAFTRGWYSKAYRSSAKSLKDFTTAIGTA